MRQWGKRRRWRPVDLVLQYANAGVYILGLRLHPRDGILWGENAAEGARLSEDRGGEGNALGNLGRAHADLGEMDKAIGYFGQALVISREIGDRRGEGRDLANLGLAYETLQRFAEARDAWTAALALFEAIGDPNAEQVRQWLAELET